MGKNCPKELKQIAQRIADQAPPDWKPLEVCDKCYLHRWITPDLLDEQSGAILPAAVVDDRLSVIAECDSCSFGKISLRTAVALATEEQGLTVLGSIRLPAKFFMERWQIKHDPFKYTVRKAQLNAHPNHVQVICEKGYDVYEALKPLEWYVKPGSAFPELEQTPKSKMCGKFWLSITVFIGAILILFGCKRKT